MIVLNTDKGLVRLDSWEDIKSRPGFTAEIDASTLKLKEIIGAYQFSSRVPCGLKSCHQPHLKGYLVVVSDGRETNIGNICGETHFGVDFNSLRRTFDRETRDAEAREKITAFKNRIPFLKAEIHELKHQETGANWIYDNIRYLTDPMNGLPKPITKTLKEMRQKRDGVLTRTRLATEEEKELQSAAAQGTPSRSKYVEETVGRLEGIEVLYEENDLRRLLVEQLSVKIDELESIDTESERSHRLRKLSKIVDDIDPSLDRAKRAIQSGRRFFRKENLRQLSGLLEGSDERKRLEAYLKSFGE